MLVRPISLGREPVTMGQKLLVVEDDRDTREFISKGLAEQGYTVSTAANGRDGLYMATDRSFDAVILDRMLPEMDGLALLRSMRAADLSTPVLMLTAMGSVDERVRGLKSLKNKLAKGRGP